MSPREVSHFHAIHNRIRQTRPPEAPPTIPPDSLADRVMVMIPLIMVIALCTLVACVAIVNPHSGVQP